jgi:hypothetical protein
MALRFFGSVSIHNKKSIHEGIMHRLTRKVENLVTVVQRLLKLESPKSGDFGLR